MVLVIYHSEDLADRERCSRRRKSFDTWEFHHLRSMADGHLSCDARKRG